MIKTDTAGKLPENFNVTEVDNIGVNTLFKDVIGNKSDNNLSGPGNDSLYGIAAYMAYHHVHSPSKRGDVIRVRHDLTEKVLNTSAGYLLTNINA